ncbi:GNAT family N-acetyltransferase [Sanguibacter antarcticus]|uniref:Ribosomal protein S18 acetylase RimI-like enzyme n=1 Tax=Sanguibacter antarcticus TaxID=372484 RepID=A0A2A9E1J9_9MICO|nr:GNAT family N-acetyltransferase [Sanguibacter antarcticus]PFG32713.1 ribosomal protein S18 acetylase RimI-like enzyme [Sanguibacter antarcticus]
MVDQLDDVTIRPAAVSDAETIARIHVASWREAYAGIVPATYLASLDEEFRKNRWTEILTGDGSRTWIAEVDRRTVGFASTGLSRDEDAEPGDQELYSIYLDPEAWGRGVARELMRTVIAELPDGVPLSLWVLADNERAQHFYRRHGFAADGVEKLEELGGERFTEVRYRRA